MVAARADEKQFDQAREFYRRDLGSLLEQYEDQFIVIIGDAVVDNDAEFSDLAHRAYGKYGYMDILMFKVEMGPPIVRFRSPIVLSETELSRRRKDSRR